MRKALFRAAVAVAGLVGAVGVASAASATDFSIDTTGSSGYAWVSASPGNAVGTIHDTNTGTNEGVFVGAIQLTGTYVANPSAGLQTLQVFCIDIHDNLATGVFTESSVADLENTQSNLNVHYTPQQVTDLTKFLASVYSPVGLTTPLMSEAVQLGVWEIISEADDTNWDVTDQHSSFWVEGLDPEVTQTANTLLAESRSQSTVGYTLHVLDPNSGNGNNQVQAFVTHMSGEQSNLGVPEPATWSMIVMGFGLLGGALRRRKQDPAFARY